MPSNGCRGRKFDSRSPAAECALGVESANGWREWISLRDGLTLEEKHAQAGLDQR